MRHFLYNTATGVFTGDTIEAPEGYPLNLPAGTSAFQAIDVDYRRRKVDVSTGVLVPYRPPPPASTTEKTWRWDEARGQYLPVETAAGKAKREAAAADSAIFDTQQAQIETLIDIVAALATPGGKPATADIAKLAAARQKVADLRAKKPKP